MSDRPSLFGVQDDDLDVSSLDLTHAASGDAAPSKELVSRVSHNAGFPDRSARPLREGRAPLTYRTGRTANFSVKTRPDAVERFYAVARSRGWKVAETFERAVELLEHDGAD